MDKRKGGSEESSSDGLGRRLVTEADEYSSRLQHRCLSHRTSTHSWPSFYISIAAFFLSAFFVERVREFTSGTEANSRRHCAWREPLLERWWRSPDVVTRVLHFLMGLAQRHTQHDGNRNQSMKTPLQSSSGSYASNRCHLYFCSQLQSLLHFLVCTEWQTSCWMACCRCCVLTMALILPALLDAHST
uniref:Putative spatzle 3 n=1 Tax=Ixodes ricinus TaxID=34613 RepID=A0A0K8RLK5_IXORI